MTLSFSTEDCRLNNFLNLVPKLSLGTRLRNKLFSSRSQVKNEMVQVKENKNLYVS
jgi:hypothetical protein